MSIAVIAGLGNPGAEYVRTRHNLGFWLVDALARDCGAVWKTETRFHAEVTRVDVAGHSVWLLKPQTFMNESGLAVGPFLRFHKLPSSVLAAVYDDITLPVGRVKVTVKGSDGGHNGITSLLAHVGTDFARFKLGIGGKAHPEMNLADHVLSRLSPEEESALAAKLPDFLNGLKLLVADGPDEAMNQLNRTKTPPPSL